MASPFPAVPAQSSTRKIRPGVELKDFTNERADGKILPKDGEKNVLITSALPYVNNQPHLGNIIGSTLSADVFARYSRQRNQRVLYVCGTDEYGTTTEVMAAKEGVTSQALCDKYHKLHAEAYEWFQIGFDHFGRTSTPLQTEIAQDIFLKLYNNGWFEEEEKEQLYCEKDQRFLADRFVEGTCPACQADGAKGDQCDACGKTYDSPLELINPKCTHCKSIPTKRPTTHLLLRLGALQPRIESWVDKTSTKGIWSSNTKSQTDGMLRMGLRSRAMTRDLKWGVSLPKELGPKWESKVMYVWFDAPIGYPSITANYTSEWKQWWHNPENVTLFQFMGKDNVPFHTVLFPCYLLGTNDPWTMLNSISTTEYLNYEGVKFSKSNNVGVFGSNARETGVPASIWRFYLLANRPETSDAEFKWDDFVAKTNNELLNNLGNFVNRMLKFVNAKYDSVLPAPSADIDYTKPYVFAPQDESFVSDVNELLTEFIDAMDHQQIRNGVKAMMNISARGNAYIQENRLDNALLASNPARCAEVALVTINLIYTLAALVHPFMPSSSDSILAQLNAIPRSIPDTFSIDLLPGHQIGKAQHLFSKIDLAQVPIWRAQYGGAAATAALAESKDASKSKKAASKAKHAKAEVPTSGVPKTEDQLALEAKIKAQGDLVRKLKGEGKSGDELKAELEKLQALKAELDELTKALNSLAL